MFSGKPRQFTARLAQLTAAGVYIEEYCMLRALPHETALRVTFIVEELFTNSVLHGYGGESEQPIWIRLDGAGSVIELTYEDAAPAYNPLERLKEGYSTPLTTSVSGRPVGGLGVFLVSQLAQTAHYAHVDGRNRLTVALAGGAA